MQVADNAVKNAELMELRSEQQRKTTDEKYLKVIEAQNDEIHRLVHDIKHHLNTIHNLSKSVEIDSYIASVESELQKSTAFSKTGNRILDIILNEYFLLCQDKNIEFETEIRTANLDFIEPAKLTALLNNILDNAIEATEKCKAPRIFLSINRSDNFNVLCCTNTCLCFRRLYRAYEHLAFDKSRSEPQGRHFKTLLSHSTYRIISSTNQNPRSCISA